MKLNVIRAEPSPPLRGCLRQTAKVEPMSNEQKKPPQPELEEEASNNLVDAGSEYSFPASDPPSYMAGAAIAGCPSRQEHHGDPVVKVPSDSEEVKAATWAVRMRARAKP